MPPYGLKRTSKDVPVARLPKFPSEAELTLIMYKTYTEAVMDEKRLKKQDKIALSASRKAEKLPGKQSN